MGRGWGAACATARGDGRRRAGVEDELAAESVDTGAWGWTLTFLEGKPIVELDDGTSIHLDDAGHAQVTNPDDAAEED